LQTETTTTITYTATDIGGNKTSCSFTVTRAPALYATITPDSLNNHLFYGYSGDQTFNMKVAPKGGTGLYTVSIAMDRKLICNFINGAGDESWSSTSSGGTKTDLYNTCGTNTANVLSNVTSLPAGGNIQVTGILLDTTIITVTVTDANNCPWVFKDTVYAEDVRCFAVIVALQRLQSAIEQVVQKILA
jgi:hypothetical protein